MTVGDLSERRPSAVFRECEVCGSTSEKAVHIATEMMFGMGGTFRYLECPRCGCLALQEVPASLRDYYPPEYYSLGSLPARSQGGLGARLRRAAMRALLANESLATAADRLCRGLTGGFPSWWVLLGELDMGIDAAILDVGCGSGHRLQTLQRYGFRKLAGCDVNMPPETDLGRGIEFWPLPVEELSGRFDLVMFHHSFEHLAGPSGVLAAAQSLLAPGGAVILRIPLAGSFAWRTYGVHWVQLDAPRHVFLFTAAGVHLLASRGGFRVARTMYDSDSLQFWGSEQYRLGVPLHSLAGDGAGLFSDVEMRRFERRAAELNRVGDGDQAAFLLRPTGGTHR